MHILTKCVPTEYNMTIKMSALAIIQNESTAKYIFTFRPSQKLMCGRKGEQDITYHGHSSVH